MNQSVGRTDNEGYVPDNVTNRQPEPMPLSEVLEKNGGDDGTRTRGLCRDRAAF
jgi:hypothetical protein